MTNTDSNPPRAHLTAQVSRGPNGRRVLPQGHGRPGCNGLHAQGCAPAPPGAEWNGDPADDYAPDPDVKLDCLADAAFAALDRLTLHLDEHRDRIAFEPMLAVKERLNNAVRCIALHGLKDTPLVLDVRRGRRGARLRTDDCQLTNLSEPRA